MLERPCYDDLPIDAAYPAGSSWGVFGEGDEVGTLNLIGTDEVRRAAQTVRDGRVFSLNWSLDLPSPPVLGRGAAAHHVVGDEGGGTDDWYDNFYPQASSQWDSLCHIRHPEHGYYNGVEDGDTPRYGGHRLGIANWAVRGIAGRFVLADIAAYRAARGATIDCATTVAVSAAEVQDVLAAQGTHVEPGSILLLRFGWVEWYEAADQSTRDRLAEGSFATPGLLCEEETARWLWDNRFAAAAADCPALEAMPFTLGDPDAFLHYRLIPLLGFAIGEMFDLRELAEHCRATGQYEGLLTAAPLNKRGGAGSTANAIAIT